MYLFQESTFLKVLRDVELPFACSSLFTTTNPAGDGDFNKAVSELFFVFSFICNRFSSVYMIKIIFSPILVNCVDGIMDMTLYA